MCEPYGYDESREYQSMRTQLDNELETNRQNDDKAFASVEYNSTLNAFVFKNVEGEERGYAYVSDMLSQDFIKNVDYDTEKKVLIITLANDKTIEIPLEDMIDITDAGDGLVLEDNKFSIKLNEACEPFLSVDENGLLMSGVQDAIDAEMNRAVSAETDLQNSIDEESKRATQAEKDISAALSVEVTDRTNSENAIKAIIGDGFSAAATETVSYKINDMGTRLEKEIQDRQTAEQEIERLVALKADVSDVYSKSETYSKQEIDAKLQVSGGTASTDGYTKEEIDAKLADYATEAWVQEQGYLTEHQSLDNYYTKEESDAKLADYYTKEEVDVKLDAKADKDEIPTDYYSKSTVDAMLSQLMTRIENVESTNGVVVVDTAEAVASAPSGSNVVLTSAAAIQGLTGNTEYNTLTIVGGNCDADIKAIVSDKATIDGMSISGAKGASNGRMQLSANTVSIKNVTVDSGSTVYNVFETSQNASKSEYAVKDFAMSNIVVDNPELTHNVANVYVLDNDASVKISDSSFNLDVDNSNVLRLANYANATGVTVTLSNIDWTYENAEGTDWRWAGLVIYQPAGADKALSGDTSALSTWTVIFDNCRYNGEKITANNFGEHSQAMYLYNVGNDSSIIDPQDKLKLVFK